MLCGWFALAAAVEVGLYLSYVGHDARFHWFTHFFVGAGTALLVMSAVALRRGRAARRPLMWMVAGHLFAMFPDVLFTWAGIAHRRWMDFFLGHISSHFIPGGNVTWLAVFLVTLAIYLVVVARLVLSEPREVRT